MADHGGKKRAKNPRHEDSHEEHQNHEAWVIPYADMLTLLMALFLVLFAIGQTDIVKFRKLAESFNNELGGGGKESIVDLGESSGTSPVSGGDGVLDGAAIPSGAEPAAAGEDAGDTVGVTTIAPPAEGTADAAAEAAEAAQALDEKRAAQAAVAAEVDALTTVEGQLREAATAAGYGDAVAFRLEARGLVVTIVTDQVLFDPGRATLQDGGRAILDALAPTLRDVPNSITIEGHTDSRPISTGQFPSNWELSTARATTVLRELIDSHGLDPAKVSASGFGDTRALGDNATVEGRTANRRVEIVVVSAAPGTVTTAG